MRMGFPLFLKAQSKIFTTKNTKLTKGFPEMNI